MCYIIFQRVKSSIRPTVILTRPNQSRKPSHHVDVAVDWCRATRSPMSSVKEIRAALMVRGIGVSDITVL